MYDINSKLGLMFCCYSWCLPESCSNLFFFGSNYILFVVHVNTLVLTELMKSEIFENHIIIKNKS